jgi:WD40 repeat protein
MLFPERTSELLLTAAGSEIRLWSTAKRVELLRVAVPTLEVTSLAMPADGSCIVSGWSDGKVRAFLPESGKLHYVIGDAHNDAVTAVGVTRDGRRVVSGGRDGRVRVWDVSGSVPAMEASWKEHKKEVTAITLSAGGEEAVTASADGSCLLWNLRRLTRSAALFASTVFKAAVYSSDESQILTVGSDRRITYWDAADCSPLRIMEGATEEVRACVRSGGRCCCCRSHG